MPSSWKQEVEDRFSVRRVGDKWDRMYADETAQLDEHNFRRRRDYATEWATQTVSADARILDLGCGAGALTSALRAAGWSCIGMDYSSDMLQYARQRLTDHGLPSGGLLRADAEKLPFRDCGFDMVICLGVISYLENYDSALAEIARVLTPGGGALITFRNAFNPVLSDPIESARAAARWLLRGKSPEGSGAGRFLDPSDVRRRILSAGLEIERFEGIGLGPYRIGGRRILREPWSIAVSDRVTRLYTRAGLHSLLAWQADVGMFTCRKPDPRHPRLYHES